MKVEMSKRIEDVEFWAEDEENSEILEEMAVKTDVTELDLTELKEIAEAHGACEDTLAIISFFNTTKDLINILDKERIAFFIEWMYKNVFLPKGRFLPFENYIIDNFNLVKTVSVINLMPIVAHEKIDKKIIDGLKNISLNEINESIENDLKKIFAHLIQYIREKNEHTNIVYFEEFLNQLSLVLNLNNKMKLLFFEQLCGVYYSKEHIYNFCFAVLRALENNYISSQAEEDSEAVAGIIFFKRLLIKRILDVLDDSSDDLSPENKELVKFSEHEKDLLLKSSYYSYKHAKVIVKGRWPEAESTIMKSPKWAYMYAHTILCDRWHEAEPVIMKDPNWAYEYAKDVIGGRWPEAEECIKTDGMVACSYAINVLKDRWPEIEQRFLDTSYSKIVNSVAFIDYSRFLFHLEDERSHLLDEDVDYPEDEDVDYPEDEDEDDDSDNYYKEKYNKLIEHKRILLKELEDKSLTFLKLSESANATGDKEGALKFYHKNEVARSIKERVEGLFNI